jgi:hypothetical protein
MAPLQVVPCTCAYSRTSHCVNMSFDPSVRIFNKFLTITISRSSGMIARNRMNRMKSTNRMISMINKLRSMLSIL